MCRTGRACTILVVTPGIYGVAYHQITCRTNEMPLCNIERLPYWQPAAYLSAISVCIQSKLGVDLRIVYPVV